MNFPKGIKWKYVRDLGEGGQGEVHLVEGEEPGKHFALKRLRENANEQAYKRFHKEIKSLKAIENQYVIQVVDQSEPDANQHWYVMEYYDGARPLLKVLKSDASPYRGNAVEGLRLFRMICEALQACHEHTPPILHRDLSPGNVLVLPDGTIRLIDFGLCQSVGDETITLADEGLGTRNYTAPECESGASGDQSPASDLYSAGKILWSAVTGHKAFAREDPLQGQKSMAEMFPDQFEMWHLQLVLERTVVAQAISRWKSAHEAVFWTRHLEKLVTGAYQPLENVLNLCPTCGIGQLSEVETGKIMHGMSLIGGLVALECDYCAYTFLVNLEKYKKRRRDRSEALRVDPRKNFWS
jgi:serine/threonine protein kinase